MSDGLAYFEHGGLRRYRVASPFIVDGIHYDPATAAPYEHNRRPMIQIIDDDDCELAYMFCSSPPTTAELDRYVQLADDLLPY